MQENSETPVKNTNSRKLKKPSKRFIAFVLFFVATGIVLWTVYAQGVQNGKQQAKETKKQSEAISPTNPLVTLPASGEVNAISANEITIQLRGKETRKATIDKNTKITKKTGEVQVTDITKGSKVVLFTKKSGDTFIATRILVQ